MKMQVSRSLSLVEEMVRFALAHFPNRPICEYRIVQKNFEPEKLDPAYKLQRIVFNGHVLVVEPHFKDKNEKKEREFYGTAWITIDRPVRPQRIQLWLGADRATDGFAGTRMDVFQYFSESGTSFGQHALADCADPDFCG